MGFPHCPICEILALISVFIGLTRSFMFLILFRDFVKRGSNVNLQFV